MKHLLLIPCFILLTIPPLTAQIIKLQSAGGGGTTPSQASNGTITHFGAVSPLVSQGNGYHNQSGFFFANIDYRPAVQTSSLAFSSSSADNTTFQVTLSWEKGNGSRRLVIVRRDHPVSATPSDGTHYAANAAFGAGAAIAPDHYAVYDGTGTGVTITGLTRATYHFKVFEYNGKYGANDTNIVYQPGTATGNPAAFAPEPTARPASLTFSDITATSMTGTFPATGSAGYLVLRNTGVDPAEIPEDGTVYTGTIGASTVVHDGSESVFSSTGLSAATTYHYAVYAYNGQGTSVNYLSADPFRITRITVPDAPAVELSNATSTNFNAEWTAKASATSYKIDVSTENDFSSYVSGYQGKDVTEISLNVTGLQASTQYFVRVRAVNESGESVNSETKFITTQSAQGTPLTINISQTTQGNQTTLSATLNGGSGTRTVKYYSRGIRSTDNFSESDVTLGDDGKYTTVLSHADITDELGIEFRFQATDDTGPKSSTSYFYRPVPPQTTIPNLPAGGALSDYRIISVPYSLTLNSTAIVFSALGAYDKRQWRFVNWNGTSYVDNPSTLVPGQGYWFNALNKTSITLGEGSVPQNNQSQPFQLPLRKGWNMIATPYPFAINWEDVRAYNDDPQVSDYHTFNGDSYTTSVLLEPWEGGFVFADNDVTLEIPVNFPTSSGGRIAAREAFTGTPGEGNWLVPVTLKQGTHVSVLNGFGMHREAAVSKDRFDRVALPAFIDLPELTTTHPDYFVPHFTRDVVPPQKTYVWSFLLNTHRSDDVELGWDNEHFLHNDVQLLLHEPARGTLLDMRTTNRHVVSAGKNKLIEIIYSADGRYRGVNREIGTAYPNPFTTETTLPGFLNTKSTPTTVSVRIRSLSGVEVYRTELTHAAEGIVQPVWKGEDTKGAPVSAGVYFYQLTFSNDHHTHTVRGKVIKR